VPEKLIEWWFRVKTLADWLPLSEALCGSVPLPSVLLAGFQRSISRLSYDFDLDILATKLLRELEALALTALSSAP
jgi:hypothetical protein